MNYEGIAKVRTVHDWGWEQSVMVLFYSWAPTWTGSRRPMFSFTIGRTLEGIGGLKVVFPMFAEGLETDEDPRPRVEADDGTILAWLDEPSLTDSTADMGPRLWAFTIRTVEPGVYFVSVGDGGEALITAEGLEMPMAPLEVEVVGFGCAFTVAPIEYHSRARQATERVAGLDRRPGGRGSHQGMPCGTRVDGDDPSRLRRKNIARGPGAAAG